MSIYRCYYMNSAGRVAAVNVIHCDTDGEARARADALLAASDHAALELWDAIQVIYRARKTTPLTPE